MQHCASAWEYAGLFNITVNSANATLRIEMMALKTDRVTDRSGIKKQNQIIMGNGIFNAPKWIPVMVPEETSNSIGC